MAHFSNKNTNTVIPKPSLSNLRDSVIRNLAVKTSEFGFGVENGVSCPRKPILTKLTHHVGKPFVITNMWISFLWGFAHRFQ